MIVKVMVNGNGGWRFFDNATAVQRGRIARDMAPPVDCIRSHSLHDGSSIVEESYIADTQAAELCDGIGLISFESHGKSYNIYTDYTAYLLNDQGKTIEKLI